MEIVVNLMFLSVSFIVFFAYRAGIKDSFYIKNNIPILPEKEKKHAENELNTEYVRMMGYEFDMAGEENDR